MKKVIIISGPTASGKSALAIELAKKIPAEIISADSMQIYKNMDIGTAKVTSEERSLVKHHLIDIIEPYEKYSVQDFQMAARNLIRDIHEKDKIPIIVGGTGLYINSIIYDYDFSQVEPNQEFRNRMEEEFKDNPQALLAKLMAIDSEKYSNLTIKDKKKIIRALEVYEFSGKTITVDSKLNTDYKYYLYVLNEDRQSLYDRINKRVDLMIEEGLIDEVKTLIEQGLNEETQSMKAIGYREVIPYLKGEISHDEMLQKLKQDSRRYAKRQLTWFRKVEIARWLDRQTLTQEQMIDIILEEINEFWICK